MTRLTPELRPLSEYGWRVHAVIATPAQMEGSLDRLVRVRCLSSAPLRREAEPEGEAPRAEVGALSGPEYRRSSPRCPLLGDAVNGGVRWRSSLTEMVPEVVQAFLGGDGAW